MKFRYWATESLTWVCMCETELEGMKECPNTLCWVDVGMLGFLKGQAPTGLSRNQLIHCHGIGTGPVERWENQVDFLSGTSE